MVSKYTLLFTVKFRNMFDEHPKKEGPLFSPAAPTEKESPASRDKTLQPAPLSTIRTL
jgi:hypothetical protein